LTPSISAATWGTLQVEPLRQPHLRQHHPARPQDRPARDDGIAEAAAAVGDSAVGLDRAGVGLHRAVEAEIAVEPPADLGRLVGVTVLRPAAYGLLEADDIGCGHRIGDARDVVLAVGADAVVDDAVVDIVGAEKHVWT
jgi:hypothetical protein